MIKLLIGIITIGISSMAFAASAPLSQAAQDTAAAQCGKYISIDPQAPMSQAQAEQLAPLLKTCVEYNSCANSNLSGVQNCARKLSTLYFSTKFNSLSSTTPPAPSQGAQQPLGDTEQPAAAPAQTPAPTPAPAANTQQQKTSGINWF